MTQEYEALAARVEAAAGPDRELDAAVAVALKVGARGILPDDHEYLSPLRKDDYREGCPKGGYWFHCRSGKSLRTASPYTASLDAATTVFSPDTMYRSGHDGAGPDPSLFYCEAITAAPECRRVRAVAVSEASARVAAALRAHLIKDQADGEMGG